MTSGCEEGPRPVEEFEVEMIDTPWWQIVFEDTTAITNINWVALNTKGPISLQIAAIASSAIAHCLHEKLADKWKGQHGKPPEGNVVQLRRTG